jgi:hypothetical protein
MAAVFCMFLAAYTPMMATLFVVEEDVHMAPQRLCWIPQNLVGAWLHHSPMLELVQHRSNSVALEFLQMVVHNFVEHLPLELWKNLLLQSFLFYFFLHQHKKSFL